MKRIFFLYFVSVFLGLTLLASGTIDSQDGFQYLAVARNMYYQHRPIAPEPAYPEKNIYMNIRRGKDNVPYSMTGIGFSLAYVPAVALSDLLHRLYADPPPVYFPLETDWSLLLFASFTNSFFAALLAVSLASLLLHTGIPLRRALLYSSATILLTNLLPLAKHSFAHMMFVSFLLASFAALQYAAKKNRPFFVAVAGLCYGVVIIAYNPTFLLAAPALGSYWVLSQKKFDWRSLVRQGIFGLIGVLPLVGFYFWFNSLRYGSSINSGYGVPTADVWYGKISVLYEGLYGLFLSPGRGFFLYSPILLTPLIFWHKVRAKKYFPELIAGILLTICFSYFHAIQFDRTHQWYQWNGESSFGPRYLSVIIPFWAFLSAHLIDRLSNRAKLLVIFPLCVFSLWVQLVGVLLPYQIKFPNLEPEIKLGGVRMTQADYGNFIPRFSPVLTLSKTLLRRIREFPQTLNHGRYAVRFYDGIDFPFPIGISEVWRGLRSEASIAYTDREGSANTLKLGFANISMSPEATYSGQIRIRHNDVDVGVATVSAGAWSEFTTNLHPSLENELRLSTQLLGTSSANQALFLRTMELGDTPVSLRTLDFPYVQSLAAKMTGAAYGYFGTVETDPWFFWRLHSQLYENAIDLWWIRVLYYWDLPHDLYLGLWVGITGSWGISTYSLLRALKSKAV